MYYCQVTVIPILSVGLLSVYKATKQFTLMKKFALSIAFNAPFAFYSNYIYNWHEN